MATITRVKSLVDVHKFDASETLPNCEGIHVGTEPSQLAAVMLDYGDTSNFKLCLACFCEIYAQQNRHKIIIYDC